MTTAEILNQMEKELYEFIASSPPNYPSVWKSLIRSRLRTLLESFGEEIITSFMEDLNYYTKDKPSCTKESPCGCHFGETFHADGMCLCDIEEKQRLKMKEIISSIEK